MQERLFGVGHKGRGIGAALALLLILALTLAACGAPAAAPAGEEAAPAAEGAAPADSKMGGTLSLAVMRIHSFWTRCGTTPTWTSGC